MCHANLRSGQAIATKRPFKLFMSSRSIDDRLDGGDGDIVLLEKPADDQSPRRIDCYAVESGKTFKPDPQRALFTLRYQHNGIPPDFELLMYGDARQWFPAVATSLFGELDRRYPHLFD
jgi:hypothetical protein